MTWSVVRQNLELPDVEEHALQSLESLKGLVTNMQKEFYLNIITKYERVAAKFGYVEPLRDPNYLQHLKTNIESMIKAFDRLEDESSKAQELTAVVEEAVQLGNKMHEDNENAHKIMKERKKEKEAELKQGD